MRHLIEQNHLQLELEKIYYGHLILVNSDHPVKRQTAEQSLEKTCERQLYALLEACHANEEIVIVSGYRSKSEQQYIYEKSLIDNGVEFTKSYVARPGESEHQTGLAIDVGEVKKNMDFIRPSFPDHGICKVFKQIAAEYGFIQRYQEGKQTITNIACEPWHYRYVGFPHSMIMEQEGLCLEEYIEYIKQFTYQSPYRYFEKEDLIIKIYYVHADVSITTVPIMYGEKYYLSGNNKDGFIVTSYSKQGSDDRGI